MGEADPRTGASSRLVSDDEPCGSGEAIIQDFHYDADVGIDVRSDNEAGVDVCDPEFTEGAVEGW